VRQKVTSNKRKLTLLNDTRCWEGKKDTAGRKLKTKKTKSGVIRYGTYLMSDMRPSNPAEEVRMKQGESGVPD